MEIEPYHIEVLADYIMNKKAGMLITTTWEVAYGNVLASIQNLNSQFMLEQEGDDLFNFKVQRENSISFSDHLSFNADIKHFSGKFNMLRYFVKIVNYCKSLELIIFILGFRLIAILNVWFLEFVNNH